MITYAPYCKVIICNIYVVQQDTQCFMINICNIQLENAPEDGPLRSETCRATKCYE